MSLEARSGNKILLKLLLAKSTDVLEQSILNQQAIETLQDTLQNQQNQLILIKRQLESISGVIKE